MFFKFFSSHLILKLSPCLFLGFYLFICLGLCELFYYVCNFILLFSCLENARKREYWTQERQMSLVSSKQISKTLNFSAFIYLFFVFGSYVIRFICSVSEELVFVSFSRHDLMN